MADTSLSLPSFHTPDTIRAHPRFAAAREAFVDTALALYEGNPFLNRLLLEASRQITFNIIVCLYFRYQPDERATWPTMTLLKEEMKKFGLLSERRIDRFVSQLTRSGFVEQNPAPGDRRARILTPTAKMIALDYEWLIINYKPLHVMFPDGGYSRFLKYDAVLQRVQRLIALGFAAQGAQLMDSNPIMMRFLNRDAGMTILFKLLQAAARSDAPHELSFTEIGSRFGVSRTHVRAVLKEAEDNGDVILSGPSKRIVALQPSLIEAFDRFVADSLSGNDLMYRLAMQQLG